MYIGGQFATSDNKLIINANQSQSEIYFPISSRGARRMYFQTGTEALASIADSATCHPPRIFFPVDYCDATIQRFRMKTKKPFQILRYDSIDDLGAIPSSTDIVVTYHLNYINETMSRRFSALRDQNRFTWVEDFVLSPLDVAQFSGDFSFNSLRKFAGLDVSVCYGRGELFASGNGDSEYFYEVEKARDTKSKYYVQPTKDLESEYLAGFALAEERLFCPGIQLAHASHIAQLSSFDFNLALGIRRKNFRTLKTDLTLFKQVECLPGDYMFFMCNVERRDELRAHCFREGIFPAVHWPGILAAKNRLSFHIDHRYSIEDMNRTFEVISRFYGN
jgi:hypothetical protein